MRAFESRPAPVLALSGVTKSFAECKALDRIDLEVAAGEAVALVGPSGCGKTTALKHLNGLVFPDQGSVSVDGTPLTQKNLILHRRRTGYVIQEVGLLPHWTVAQNIATVLRLAQAEARVITARVHALLDAVGLARELENRKPHQLSGGQRQRVGIARALAAEPRFLLMDEPFGSLDPLTRVRLRQLVVDLRRARQLSLVLVTHDLEDARAIADRVCVMRQGRVVEVLAPNELDTARDAWVRGFLSPGALGGDA